MHLFVAFCIVMLLAALILMAAAMANKMVIVMDSLIQMEIVLAAVTLLAAVMANQMVAAFLKE